MLSLETSFLSIMYVRLCHTYLWSLLNYSRGTHCTPSQRSLEWLLKQFREPMVFKMLISSMKVTCEFIYWFQLCLLFIETSSWLRGTLHWESLWPLQPIVSHWCKMPSSSHFSFTLELEGLRDQGVRLIWHTCIESYMACNGYCFMLYWILWPHKMNILRAWYSLQMSYKSPHNFMVMGLGHKCNVALWYELFSLRTLQNLLNENADSLLFDLFKKKGILDVCPLEKIRT